MSPPDILPCKQRTSQARRRTCPPLLADFCTKDPPAVQARHRLESGDQRWSIPLMSGSTIWSRRLRIRLTNIGGGLVSDLAYLLLRTLPVPRHPAGCLTRLAMLDLQKGLCL
eukprot:scaffold79392_cov14-Tisochrysis_lutea.AAC.1